MDLQTRFNHLLVSLNIHPPPSAEEVVNSPRFVKFSRKRHDNSEHCTGYKLFRFNVAIQSKTFGESNPFVISKVSNLLWESSTPQEKSEYINLGKRLKSLLNDKNLSFF